MRLLGITATLVFAIPVFAGVLDFKQREEIKEKATKILESVVAEINAETKLLNQEIEMLNDEIRNRSDDLKIAEEKYEGTKATCNDKASLGEKLNCHKEADQSIDSTRKTKTRKDEDGSKQIAAAQAAITKVVVGVLKKHDAEIAELSTTDTLLLRGDESILVNNEKIMDVYKKQYENYYSGPNYSGPRPRIIHAEVESLEETKAVFVFQTDVLTDEIRKDPSPYAHPGLSWKGEDAINADSSFGQDLVRVEVNVGDMKKTMYSFASGDNFAIKNRLDQYECMIGKHTVRNMVGGTPLLPYWTEWSSACGLHSNRITLVDHSPLWKEKSK
jgi:hypothetical protein